jgi:hypothetical protein
VRSFAPAHALLLIMPKHEQTLIKGPGI